jgi:calcium-dependent protein kinase
MGCNKSVPEDIVRSIPEPDIAQVHMPRRQKTNRVVAKEVGSINDHFKILKAIGTNNLGTMLYAQDIQSDTFRAIREVNKNLAKNNTHLFEELEIIMSMDHPNIVKIYQTIETSKNYYIVFEYLDGGNLRSKVKRGGNEMLVSKYAHEIIAAIKYMHLLGFIHCDLSPEHILFCTNDHDSEPKIVHWN